MSERYFKQPSGNQHNFANAPQAEIQRSTFDMSHGHKTTINAGLCYPTFYQEVLPGDTFNVKSTAFARLNTPLKPIMDNLHLDTHYFFVPYRLVWDNWESFITGDAQGTADQFTPGTPAYEARVVHKIPQTTIKIADNQTPVVSEFSLWRYFGIPLQTNVIAIATTSVSALPFRAYALIWNEWYRDQNLNEPLVLQTGDGPDTNWSESFVLARNKRHDYFTSCLPWPQKGAAVHIPLGAVAPVESTELDIEIKAYESDTDRKLSFNASDNTLSYSGGQYGSPGSMQFGSHTGLFADLTDATAVTINDLRTAFQVQKMLERDARGGSRYVEQTLSHFGVTTPDFRVARPEYLGGSSAPVSINPVASTAAQESAPQANLAATGTAVGRGSFKKSFTEHGIIIGITSIRSDITYQNGIEKFWNRVNRYDFYFPALAHLGEQPVRQEEIYVSATQEDNAKVFGYQEIYADYRYKPSRVTGKLASADAASLDVWHLAQDFTEPPMLNAAFIRENPPIERIVAVPSEPHFIMDIWFSVKAQRPMPVYSVPGLIDHF